MALLPPVISLFWTNFFADIFPVPIPPLVAQVIGTAAVQAKNRAETQAVFRANREKLPPRMGMNGPAPERRPQHDCRSAGRAGGPASRAECDQGGAGGG